MVLGYEIDSRIALLGLAVFFIGTVILVYFSPIWGGVTMGIGIILLLPLIDGMLGLTDEDIRVSEV